MLSTLRRWLFDGPQTDPNYQPEPEDRPGGFDWGQGVAAGGEQQEQQQEQQQQ